MNIDTAPVDVATAAEIEAAEMRAWADVYAAAPADWAESVGLGTREVGGALVIRWAATGRPTSRTALCAFMVADGLANGARSFLADIELPSAEMDTPAYRYFGELGFKRPYVRTHWARF